MHILSPETDNCPSWISGRERMTVENISWSISTKESCRPQRGLNPRPPGLLDCASNWATEAGRTASWISDWNNFSYFWSTSDPDTAYQVSSQLAFWIMKKTFEIDFQDSSHGKHLEFPIKTISPSFELQVTLMFSIKFPVLAFGFRRKCSK